MAVFHVFVDGSTDTSPGAIERLGQAIAAHYGLGAPDLIARLQKGRFRVKGNTDRTTADTYARDLARLGARVTIEEATADNSQRSTPLPFPAVRPATPPAGMPVASGQPIPVTGLAAAGPRPATPSTTPPSVGGAGTPSAPPVYSSALAAAGAAALAAPGFRPQSGKASVPPPMGGAGTPSTPPPIGAAPAGGFTSGLSAAFSGDQPAADLGALGGGDAAFSLASLDGVDDSSPTGGSIGPAVTAGGSGGGMAASIGPAMSSSTSSSAGGGAATPSAPLDMFAPPDAADAQLAVNIASDEQDFSARKRASTPPPVDDAAEARPSSQRIPATPTTGQLRKSQPIPVPTAPVTVLASEPSKLGPLGNERVRFAAGVVLAVLLGFVPAHFIAKAKAESAESAIDRKVIAAQQAADTPEVYANLDRMRADQLDRKESEHRNAALIGFALWALVGSGIAFVWFRKIPWDA